VATLLSAYQSSVWSDILGSYPASRANDGKRNPSLAQLSCSHSLQDTNPWWAVDLGLPLTVTGVFFTNRDEAGARSTLKFGSNVSISADRHWRLAGCFG